MVKKLNSGQTNFSDEYQKLYEADQFLEFQRECLLRMRDLCAAILIIEDAEELMQMQEKFVEIQQQVRQRTEGMDVYSMNPNLLDKINEQINAVNEERTKIGQRMINL